MKHLCAPQVEGSRKKRVYDQPTNTFSARPKSLPASQSSPNRTFEQQLMAGL